MKADIDLIIHILNKASVKPTSNRILVLRTIIEMNRPVSLSDLENNLLTLEKSSIFRVLRLFLRKGVIHSIEDGKGLVRYEICTTDNTHVDDDMHVHFYCEACEKVFCFKTLHAPILELPEGFQVHAVNYMLKGLCPDCQAKKDFHR